jgi:hypothetical protein
VRRQYHRRQLCLHLLRLAMEGVRLLLHGIDYLFAVTLFFSWLWLCLEENSNPLAVAIERVIVSPDTGARLKSVLCATGGACVRAQDE